jgi:hypothetical protein
MKQEGHITKNRTRVVYLRYLGITLEDFHLAIFEKVDARNRPPLFDEHMTGRHRQDGEGLEKR